LVNFAPELPTAVKELLSLNKYIKKYKFLILMGILCVILSNFFAIYVPVFVRQGLDDAYFNSQLFGYSQSNILYKIIMFNALGFGIAIVLASALKGVFMFFMRQTLVVASREIEYDQKNELFLKYEKLGENFYRENYTGDLMSRITEDISNVRMYIGPAIMYFANVLFSFIMIITQMIMVNKHLAFWVIVPLPILSISIYYVSQKINLGNKKIQEQLSVITTHAQETFSGIRILKSFGAEKYFSKDFNDQGVEFQNRNLKLAMVNSLFFPLMMLLVGLSTIIVLYVGGREVEKGVFTPGNLAEFVIYLNMLIWPVASLGWTTALVQKASASQKRINDFLNREEVDLQDNDVVLSLSNQIEFNKITHKYIDKIENALTDVSFKISKGEIIGITGKTGSGKSTLLQLLTKQIQVQSGQIMIDDQSISSLHLKAYRKMIAYVPQDVFLFSDTIEANISFGVSEYSQEQLDEIIRITCLDKDIALFEHGKNTILGERGVSLSGGQKQRVSLARALMKDSDILILDDCLSAVDAETESRIIYNLKEVFLNKTVIITSHRVAPLQHANNIIILEKGKIIESGNHEFLISFGGYYQWLYENQTA
jgi:ATP-binding cassette, subfamily B, multidrug efflux pump